MIYLENEAHDPFFNQALEEYAFEHIVPGETLFMLWRNEPAVVCGCYQNVFAEVDMLRARDQGVRVVRRISGGGTVYHDMGNVNYTVIAPAEETVDYARFIQPVVSALDHLGIPAVMSRTCDISVGGLKVSGSAQKTAKGRVLHHGTLLYDTDLSALHALADGRRVKFATRGIQSVPWPVANMRMSLPGAGDTASFMAALREELAGGAPVYRLSAGEEEAVSRMAREKYATWDWTYGRSPAFSCETVFDYAGQETGICYEARRGVIESVRFGLADETLEEAAGRLRGVQLEKEALDRALAGLSGLQALIRAML